MITFPIPILKMQYNLSLVRNHCKYPIRTLKAHLSLFNMSDSISKLRFACSFYNANYHFTRFGSRRVRFFSAQLICKTMLVFGHYHVRYLQSLFRFYCLHFICYVSTESYSHRCQTYTSKNKQKLYSGYSTSILLSR